KPLELARGLRLGFDFYRQLHQLVVRLDDFFEFDHHLLSNLFALLFQRLLGLRIGCDIDDVLRVDLTFEQLLVEPADLFDGYERARERLVDALVSALDSFGDSDFVLAGEERNRAHFAKVEPHRIERLILPGFEVYVDFIGWFFGRFWCLFFFDSNGVPQRFGLTFINFGYNALDIPGGSEVLLDFVRVSQQHVFVHSTLHFLTLAWQRVPRSLYYCELK